MSERLDIELVIRELARSRNHAAQLIEQSRVTVNGKLATKSSAKIQEADVVELSGGPDYVSRAGHKLAVALEKFEIKVSGWALDAGASTGGFTQVLLERGAEGVVAVDVGHGQMSSLLLEDSRVVSLEGVNLRNLTPETLQELAGRSFNFSLVVADLSFISLTLVMEQLRDLAPEAPMVLLVKPQFEVGKHSLNASGIVTDWRDRHRALVQVVDSAASCGYEILGMAESSILGTHGNTEYLLWITPTGVDNRPQWENQISALARRQ